MSAIGTTAAAGAGSRDTRRSDGLRAYFWSDNRRRVQTVLGLIWLLDGGLQFQAAFYERGFTQGIVGIATGQPGWIHDSMVWAADLAGRNLGVWNTLFALTQVALGFALLYRPLVKPALLASFGWALFVWWFGEGFGGMFVNEAQPMTGAPGGVLMYLLVGLIAWPGDRPGGLLGARGARIQWAALWLVMAYLWLTAANNSPDATSGMLNGISSGIGPITSLQNHLASASRGGGVPIAFVLAAVSAAIGIAVARGWHARAFLWLAIVLNVLYWVFPQGVGGLLAGGATDPNSAPLFVLLAAAMFGLVGGRPARE
jgi:hypothetical protein